MRKNNKEQIIDYSNSIKKSNELSMAKLNQGLTLNQMQLLAYSIYSTQQDGKTKFQKHEFQKKFEIDNYHTEDAFRDTEKVSALRFSTGSLESKKFGFTPVFSDFQYDHGKFSIEWNPKFIPHILELQIYSMVDLTITAKFKSSFSWTLYDFLKGHYANWHKELSKEALMKLFSVEDRVTYQKNTNRFKNAVLDVAKEEINKYTELEVWYTEKKVGNKIIGFVLHWSTGKTPVGATKDQLALLREIHNEIEKNMFDYLSLNDVNYLDQARRYIISIKDMKDDINKGLSAKKADEYIKESKASYKQLETLLENEGNQRDTSIYYNWLLEDE